MEGFDTYAELLAYVEERGHTYQTEGYALDGSPIVVIEAGGDADPPILVTAGAHATEHAGVRAAVALLDELETDRRVLVVPSRDPVGLNGYEYAVESAIGGSVTFDSFPELADVLRIHGDVVLDDEDVVLALIGDIGFATREPTPGKSSCLRLMSTLKEHAADPDSDLLDPFEGRRIYAPAGHTDVAETGDFERAYTFLISPRGEFMHLNRFFDRDWAPPETRVVRDLMAEVEPVLTFDLHESSRQGLRYHLSARPGRTDEADELGERVASAILDGIEGAGFTLATDEDIFGNALDVVAHSSDEDEGDDASANQLFYEKLEQGAYRVDPNATTPPRRGEGLNAVDYAAENYGLAYTTETGMHGTFEGRVRAAVGSVQTAADVAADYW